MKCQISSLSVGNLLYSDSETDFDSDSELEILDEYDKEVDVPFDDIIIQELEDTSSDDSSDEDTEDEEEESEDGVLLILTPIENTCEAAKHVTICEDNNKKEMSKLKSVANSGPKLLRPSTTNFRRNGESADDRPSAAKRWSLKERADDTESFSAEMRQFEEYFKDYYERSGLSETDGLAPALNTRLPTERTRVIPMEAIGNTGVVTRPQLYRRYDIRGRSSRALVHRGGVHRGVGPAAHHKISYSELMDTSE